MTWTMTFAFSGGSKLRHFDQQSTAQLQHYCANWDVQLLPYRMGSYVSKAIRTKNGVTFIPKTISRKTFDVTQDLTLHRAGFGHQAKFLISEFTGSVHRVSETSLLCK